MFEKKEFRNQKGLKKKKKKKKKRDDVENLINFLKGSTDGAYGSMVWDVGA